MKLLEKWTQYRDTRRGDYAFRARTRYNAVADRLYAMGLDNAYSTVLDVGAGSCQFGRYLRERGFRGLYLPIDAVLDGTDLETWVCPIGLVDYSVCIEVVEHVHNPVRLLVETLYAARHGCVMTTPNPEAVDVLACDPTHVSAVYPATLKAMSFHVERHSWFGVPDDTLLAWRSHGPQQHQ